MPTGMAAGMVDVASVHSGGEAAPSEEARLRERKRELEARLAELEAEIGAASLASSRASTRASRTSAYARPKA